MFMKFCNIFLCLSLISIITLSGCDAAHKSAVDERTEQISKALAAQNTLVVASKLAEQKRLCQDGEENLIAQATKLKTADPDAAFDLLHKCEGLTDSVRIKNLKRDAMIALQKKRVEASEKQRKIELAQKKKRGVSIGMSQTDVLLSSWGKPRKINTTTTSNASSEQWVYEGGYLYFTDGVLTTIQN
jgi:hypothetical protein